MGKSERNRKRREQADEEVRNSPSGKLLLQRMAYHRAILAKEKERSERRAAVPPWRRLLHLY